MKTQQKNVLWIVLTAILAYVIGAFLGFPFSQGGLTSGDLGGIRRANKQQELVNSPADLKLAEKYQSDSNYRNTLTAGYGILYVQTKATLATIESLKKETGSVKELASYSVTMNEITEVGNQLATTLEGGLQGLKAVSEKKPADNLTFKLSQSLNLFQLMNSRLADLEEFSEKTQQLGAQKKINDDVLKTYSEFLVESSDIASSCGDNARAKRTLGFFGKAAGMSGISMAATKNAALNYAAVAGSVNLRSNCGQRAAGVIKDIFLNLQTNSAMVGQGATNSAMVGKNATNSAMAGKNATAANSAMVGKNAANSSTIGMITVEPILMSRDAGSMSLKMSQMGGVGRIEKFKPLVSLTSEMTGAIMNVATNAGKGMGRQERYKPLNP
jgi:hypothetical protein